MGLRAADLRFGSLSTYVYPGGYNSTKLGLGPLMTQRTGGTAADKFIGPDPLTLVRPVETGGAIPALYPHVITFSSTEQWVFCADGAAAAATRRVQLFRHRRLTGVTSWEGFINITLPAATAHTVRGFRMTYDKYSTGTVAVSGTAVTGTSTTWSASLLAVGSRIGFGSTDPTQITTWYEITAIGSDTGITIDSTAGTITAGTSYVIEELRAVMLTTNATTTNGGLFVTKGLRIENFSAGGLVVAAATTVDNIRACYWLADASTVTHITASGLGLVDRASWTQHFVWGLQGTTTMQLYQYNLRASLSSLSSGKSTQALGVKTGVTGTLTGTGTQTNNARLANVSHGPGAGLNCLYFTTGTRIYRTSEVSTITNGSTSFLADSMQEIPPGSITTMGILSVLSSIEYSSVIDKFLICTNGNSRIYLSQYRTDGGQMDRVLLCDTKQLNQSSTDSNAPLMPSTTLQPFTSWIEGGLAFLVSIGTTATTNLIWTIPLGADWEYANITNNRIVTPEISTPNCRSLHRAFTNEVQVLGGRTGQNLGLSTEPYRVYYRTSGISDNSGTWILLGDDQDLSGVGSSSSIQFMFEFRTIGITCIPSRILSCGVLYQDFTSDSHYQPSIANSNRSSKIFAWRFATAYGTVAPPLQIKLYDAENGNLLLTDDTSSPTGTFQKSTDGGSNWTSWNNTDKGNENTYVRYTPVSLADNLKVRPLLMEL